MELSELKTKIIDSFSGLAENLHEILRMVELKLLTTVFFCHGKH